MSEIARFPARKVWRRPLLQPAKKYNRPQKTLRVTSLTEGFTAHLVFEKQDGTWILTKPDPILSWMRNMLAYDAKMRLEADGLKWEWVTGGSRNVDTPSHSASSKKTSE
jgi:hypothetical protein